MDVKHRSCVSLTLWFEIRGEADDFHSTRKCLVVVANPSDQIGADSFMYVAQRLIGMHSLMDLA